MSRVFMWSCFVSILFSMASRADDFHIFRDNEGREVRAKIIKYDAQRNLVELERENKARIKTAPGTFCQKDQNYIRDWDMIRGFKSSSYFMIDADKKVVESWTEERQNASKKSLRSETTAYVDYEKIAYDVSIANRNPFPLENVKVEYRVFYTQDVVENQDQVTKEHCVSGKKILNKMDPRSTADVQTEQYRIFEYRTASGWTSKSGHNRYGGKARGIWLRLTLNTDTAGSAVREYCVPRNLMEHQVWVAEKKPAGKKNNDSKKGKKKGKGKKKKKN